MPRPHRVIVYRGTDRRWWWRRLAGNHRNVSSSEQGFRTKHYCKRDAIRDLPASVVEGCGYTLEVQD